MYFIIYIKIYNKKLCSYIYSYMNSKNIRLIFTEVSEIYIEILGKF